MVWVRMIISVVKVLLILGIIDVASGNMIPEMFNTLGHMIGESMMQGGKQ